MRGSRSKASRKPEGPVVSRVERPVVSRVEGRVRCAIYTRKSSEEGLEQDFNSLDAQREACAAYVASQASEGWQLLPDAYDDGGLSGGTLERPALQRLLGEVKQGRIDIIVVYKVDRLTRSLLDFARLVETFDAAGVSFVSVTQSFNTTTSMGRLTLNMLLSFAQFEREVTAERIRDKIAASKARGMWMGGTPPLGYRGEGRSLAVVDAHADLIRTIFARYRALGNVRRLAASLAADGLCVPERETGTGRRFGGGTFCRGQLYTILRNPIYRGHIAHKGKLYPGNHDAIIPHEEWEAVQAQLAANGTGPHRDHRRRVSLLAGLLVDRTGEPLICVHTAKGAQRYRYYVRKADPADSAVSLSPALRIPAREIEQVVRQELDALLGDPLSLAQRCGLEVAPDQLSEAARQCALLREGLRASAVETIGLLVAQIRVHPDRLAIELQLAALAQRLGLSCRSASPTCAYEVALRLTRTGRAVRLIEGSGALATGAADPALARLVARAHCWWRTLAQGEQDIATLSVQEGVTASYMTRVVRLAFLAPEVTSAALAGTLRAGIDAQALLATGAIPAEWKAQREVFLPA